MKHSLSTSVLLAGLALSTGVAADELGKTERVMEEAKGEVMKNKALTREQAQKLFNERFPEVPKNDFENNRLRVYTATFGTPTQREWRIVRGVEKDKDLEKTMRELLDIPTEKGFDYLPCMNYMSDGKIQMDFGSYRSEKQDDNYLQHTTSVYFIWDGKKFTEFDLKREIMNQKGDGPRMITPALYSPKQEDAVRAFLTEYLKSLPPQLEK